MESSEKWIPFDVLDMVPKKNWPRVIKVKAWEISPQGRIRFIDPIKQEYRNVKLIEVEGVKYFTAILGSTGGNLVVQRWPVQELVERYFKK